MASIKCKAYGRRYSYHDSDLCPHCGAYNKPGSRMRVDFDKDGNAELLNEKQFLQQSAVGRKRKDCYEQKECHEGAARQVRIPGLDHLQLTEKLKQYSASLRKTEDGELSEEGGKVLLGVLAFVLLILSVVR